MLGLLFIYLALSHAYPADNTGRNSTEAWLPALQRRADDPTSFDWVHRFAAIGDSFTAGIGAGSGLGNLFNNHDDWKCSRYDAAYPVLIHGFLGPTVEDFQFPACSGDRSEQIYAQANALQNNIDLLVMTAGGNDLCLSGMISQCVLLPYGGENACTAIIDKARENIDSILKPNLKDILLSLGDKMAEDGIVIFNGYARYFNTETDGCDKQSWDLASWVMQLLENEIGIAPQPLRLTQDRREKFNELVLLVNDAIKDVVEDVRDEVEFQIGFSNWDRWAIEGVRGQMCDPESEGRYPDPDQPDLQFFKPNTPVIDQSLLIEMKKRLADSRFYDTNESIYDTRLWKTPNPAAEALHALDPRAPKPPGCPGDNNPIQVLAGEFIPDMFGKYFHPNELGHETVASFAIAEAVDQRAKILGLDKPACKIRERFRCWQEDGRKGYASANQMNENYKDFCEHVESSEVFGWRYAKSYHVETPDEHEFVLQVGQKTKDWSKDECLESFERIINGCDGNDPNNPMNWKFGGTWKRDQYTYEINIKRDNRP